MLPTMRNKPQPQLRLRKTAPQNTPGPLTISQVTTETRREITEPTSQQARTSSHLTDRDGEREAGEGGPLHPLGKEQAHAAQKGRPTPVAPSVFLKGFGALEAQDFSMSRDGPCRHGPGALLLKTSLEDEDERWGGRAWEWGQRPPKS